jgi:multisubunit Na+/H+ antiporter MnhG subunit
MANSTAIPLHARQQGTAVRVARRLVDFGWFLSHCIAIAVLTGIGAVIALLAVTLFVLAAPVAGLALASAMRRRDLRLRGVAAA